MTTIDNMDFFENDEDRNELTLDNGNIEIENNPYIEELSELYQGTYIEEGDELDEMDIRYNFTLIRQLENLDLYNSVEIIWNDNIPMNYYDIENKIIGNFVNKVNNK